jgi:Leucine-rich repeat (LRR) protein
MATTSSSSHQALWPVKAGGVLDRSRTQSTTLHPIVCSRVAAESRVREVQLHHNSFATLPNSLAFFADTLASLSLAHNQLVGDAYFAEGELLELPALRELNLASNHITSLVPLTTYLVAPRLEKLDVSANRITELPLSSPSPSGGDGGGGSGLRAAFPLLVVLLVSDNHLVDLDPDTIRGLHIVDAANNDIAKLNPRIGLLGGSGGLQRLDVQGNRFRVPRWSVLERGTEVTLRWLRGRVPVAEMSTWRDGNTSDGGSSPDTSLADVD